MACHNNKQLLLLLLYLYFIYILCREEQVEIEIEYEQVPVGRTKLRILRRPVLYFLNDED